MSVDDITALVGAIAAFLTALSCLIRELRCRRHGNVKPPENGD